MISLQPHHGYIVTSLHNTPNNDYLQALNGKILLGVTLLQPRPNAFGMQTYFSGNYVFPSPKLSEDQKKRSLPQFGTKISRSFWDLFVLKGPFLSNQPALKSRWGDAKPRWWDANSRWGKASPYNLSTVSRVLGASEQAAN